MGINPNYLSSCIVTIKASGINGPVDWKIYCCLFLLRAPKSRDHAVGPYYI